MPCKRPRSSSLKTSFFCLLLLLAQSPYSTAESRMNRHNTDPCSAGEKLIEISEILDHEHLSEQDLQIIHQTGTDTRFYLLVRGLLIQQLQLAEDAVHRASGDRLEALQLRLKRLKKALRMVDLE
jgi:hypothetical protein